MGLPGVKIEIANGQLGRVVAVADATAGLVITGAAEGDLTLSAPVQLFSFDDLTALGVTQENNPMAFKDVKAFYDLAGAGAELWLMVVSGVVLLTDMCDETENYARKLLDAAGGKIRLLGVNRAFPQGYEPTISQGLDQDVITALGKLQTMAGHYAAAYKPFRALLPAKGFLKTNISSLMDLKQGNDNRVSVILGSDTLDGEVAIGLTLGRLASIPVQRSIARVKDGDVGLTSARFPDGTPVEELESSWDAIHDKGYVFFRRIYGRSGYFFTDDPTATADTDDFSSIARGRVIDKAHVISYLTFVEELNEEIPVDVETGKVAPGLIAAWKTDIEQALGVNMTAKGEIVSAECYIDPAQNILSSDILQAAVRILPVGYAKTIEILLGLSNPYKSSQ